MLLPRFLLGSFADVRRQTSRYLRSLAHGESTELELIDTRTETGLIVLDDQNGFRTEERHFQMYAIFEEADGTRYRRKCASGSSTPYWRIPGDPLPSREAW